MSYVKKNDVVEIHFLDHCQDGNKALPFIVWGRVDRIYKKSLRIASWAHETPGSRVHGGRDNETSFTIVKAAITKINLLLPEPATLPPVS